MKLLTGRLTGVAAVGVSLALSAALVGLGLSHHLPGSHGAAPHLAPPATTTTTVGTPTTISRAVTRPTPPAGPAPARGSGPPGPPSSTTTTRPAPAPPAPPPKPRPCITVPVVGSVVCP